MEHLVNIPTYLQDPTIAEASQPAVKEALVIVSLATTRKWSALILQTAQALSVLAVYDAGAPGGPAACRGKGRGVGGVEISEHTSDDFLFLFFTYKGRMRRKSQIDHDSIRAAHLVQSDSLESSCCHRLP